jgi:vacuolar protein sorting-associated protein 1
MARDLDPQGMRTIGVITKIDIMGPGTDARKMLSNEEIELKLGYVGVRNRSQQNIKV